MLTNRREYTPLYAFYSFARHRSTQRSPDTADDTVDVITVGFDTVGFDTVNFGSVVFATIDF